MTQTWLREVLGSMASSGWLNARVSYCEEQSGDDADCMMAFKQSVNF